MQNLIFNRMKFFIILVLFVGYGTIYSLVSQLLKNHIRALQKEMEYVVYASTEQGTIIAPKRYKSCLTPSLPWGGIAPNGKLP